jgi:hypothetical protein
MHMQTGFDWFESGFAVHRLNSVPCDRSENCKLEILNSFMHNYRETEWYHMVPGFIEPCIEVFLEPYKFSL